MSTYTANIEIAVKGAQELKRLSDQIQSTSELVQSLNNYIGQIGVGSSVRNIQNLSRAVDDSAYAFRQAALGTNEATAAAQAYALATKQLNAGLAERVALLKEIADTERQQRLASKGIRDNPTQYTGPIGPGAASPVALSSKLGNRIENILKERQGAAELESVLASLAKKDIELSNSKLDAKALAIQTALDNEAAGAAELTAILTTLEQKDRELSNSKLDAKALAIQTALDKQTTAAAQAAIGAAELAAILGNLEEQDRLVSNSKLDAKALAIQTALDNEAKGAAELELVLANLQEQDRLLSNSKLDAKALAIQTALDKEAASAAAAALAAKKLTQEMEAASAASADFYSKGRLRQAAADAIYKQANAETYGYTGKVPALLPAGMTSAGAGMLNTVNDRIKQETIITNLRKTDEKLFNQYKIEQIQRAYDIQIDEVDRLLAAQIKADEAFWASHNKRWKLQNEQEIAATAKKQKSNQRNESLALGVGFPLMFGAGPGMLAGSLAGSFMGSGFGGQILLGGLGQKLDELGQTAIATATAMRDPIAGFEKIKEAGLLASKSQEFYIQKLIEAGRTAEATAAIQNEVIKKVGVSGVNDLNKLAAASDKYNRTLAEASLQLQVALAGPLKGLLEWVTNITAQAGAGLNEMNRRNAIEQGLSPAARKELEQRKQKLTQTTSPLTLSQEFTKLYTEYQSKVKQQSIQGTALDPATRESQKKAAEQTADTIKDAYRTGFRLQQQAADLQRQGTDLQRRVAEDVYNKQQEILRLQVDNDRQRKQVAIEIVDLEYRRRISNEEGRVAAVLEAEAALMKTKAEGEATIESKRRLLELDIDKQKRETENYIFELGRTIDGIRRATLNYEMDVADYRLKIERQIGEQRRIEEAGQAVGDQTNAAPAAFAPLSKLIGGVESYGGNYGAFNRGGTNQGHFAIGSGKDPNLVNMSIAEIQRRQLAPGVPANQQLHAVGKYQIIGDTLKSLLKGNYGPTGVKRSDKFTPDVQEKLFAALAKNRIVPGNANKTMQGLRQEWIGLQNVPDAKLLSAIKTMMENKPSAATVEPQLTKASSKVVARPSVETPDLSGVEATRIKMSKQDAQIRREALSIEQQLQNLREQGALDRLAEVARGSKDIQQRKDAIAYAKAELATVGATSQDRQELLAFEAQSAVKLKLKEEENLKISNQIKANDALTKEQKTYVLGQLQEALDITKQQIALDKEALVIAQQPRFKKEQEALQAQFGVTGTGLGAGFIGQAGQAFESEMLKSGDPAKAAMLAEQTQALELATTKARALESAYQDIGTAMASTLTEGVAGLVAGTTTAQQVFSDFLKGVGDALMKAAQQMIAQYLAIAAAKALAGLFGGGSLGGGGAGGAADGSGFGATAFDGGGTFGSQGFQMPSILGRAVGGPVTGNTPYMVGERGPELFVPGSSGTIVPAGPTASLRESMGSPSAGGTSPVLNMTFETTRINGTEYVSREQLEAAMMQTRRQASADGARRGMSMTLDKLQQSPQTRSRVGIG